MAAQDYKLSFAENFALSGVAAVTSKTICAPIERIKLLIQNQGELKDHKPYKGIVDCAKRTIAAEGVGPLWLGNVANCLRYFPTQALNFAFKDSIKAMFKTPKDAAFAERLASNVAAGGLAGSMSLLFVYSLDFARTRLAMDVKNADGKRQYNGLVDLYKQTWAAEGLGGLYRGFAVSCAGIFVYRGCYFGFYDTARPMVSAMAGVESPLLNFAVGYACTVAAGLMSYPLDTVRRRLMMTVKSGAAKAEEKPAAKKYKNAFHAFGVIVKEEGAASLFRGAGANIARGVAGAGVLAGFDEFKKAYVNFRMQ